MYYNVNKNDGSLTPVAGGTLYADTPVGTIQAYGGSTFPDGWLLCDGTELNRTDYPDLFAVIGTSFGTPSADTKFCLPDMREATFKGVGLTSKSNNHYDEDGLALGEFIDDRMQSHTHKVQNGYDGSDPNSAERGNGIHGYSLTSNNATGRTGTTTEVKAVGVNFIIKAKSTGAPTDIIEGVRDVLGSYSTTETVVGTWVDGKPIYRQAISVGTPQLGSGGWVELVTYSFAVDTFVSCTLVNKTSGSTTGTQLYNNFQIRQGSSKKVEFLFEQNITAATSRYVILEYTKV